MFYLFLFIDLAILRVGAEQNGLQGGNPESPPARCAVNNQHVKIFDVLDVLEVSTVTVQPQGPT